MVIHLHSGNLDGGVEGLLTLLARQKVADRFWLTHEGPLAQRLRSLEGIHLERIAPTPRWSRPWTLGRARRDLTRRLEAVVPRSTPASASAVASASASAPLKVVAHGAWMLATLGPVLAKHPRVELILALHDVPNERHWVERRARRVRPCWIAANSRVTAEAARHLWGAEVPIALLPPPTVPLPPAALALRDDPDARARIRREWGAAPSDLILLAACRPDPIKGLGTVIEALARLEAPDPPLHAPTVRFWWAGAPHRPQERREAQRLERLARSHGLLDRGQVRFLGPRQDIPHLLALADLLVQPNLGPEGYGLSFVEALRLGRPVLTTPLGAARDHLDDSCAFWVAPGDPAAIAAVLEQLRHNRSMLARATAQARLRGQEPQFDPLHLLSLWRDLRPRP